MSISYKSPKMVISCLQYTRLRFVIFVCLVYILMFTCSRINGKRFIFYSHKLAYTSIQTQYIFIGTFFRACDHIFTHKLQRSLFRMSSDLFESICASASIPAIFLWKFMKHKRRWGISWEHVHELVAMLVWIITECVASKCANPSGPKRFTSFVVMPANN